MKYCSKCGNELLDEAVYCHKCGNRCSDELNLNKKKDTEIEISVQRKIAKVFMIVGSVFHTAITIYIGLIWCIPMTVAYFDKVKKGQHVSLAFKICTLLFVSLFAGIFMLCDKEKKQ